jgi:hypothetical protein
MWIPSVKLTGVDIIILLTVLIIMLALTIYAITRK